MSPPTASPTDTTPRRRLLGPLALVLALAPTLWSGWQALSPGQGVAAPQPRSERERVLQAIPNDAAVLINVKYRDMPASPDILNLGKRSTKALERCLADNVDANNRALCAVTLHALGDRRALATLQAALADWEADVRYQVVRALGAMPDESSVEPLLELYRRKDELPYVRRAILRSLRSISDKRVVQFLRGELRAKLDEDQDDLRPEAFDALWANRHLMARTTLVSDTRAALASDNHSLVLSATLASAELRAPQLVDALVPLMEHPSDEVRNKAVYALGHIGDKKATTALLDRLPRVRESRMLNNIAFALERLDKAAFYASIKEVVEHKQAIIRLNAAFVLGDVRHAEGLPLLETALGDASDYVRTSAIVAVGKLGNTDAAQNERAIGALEPFFENENLSVRQEAIYAVHALSEGGRNDLIHDQLFKLDRRRHPGIVRRAAVALAKANDPRVKGYILNCFLDGGCGRGEVGGYLTKRADASVEGRLLLAWARGDSRTTPLISDLKPSGTLPIAKSTLEESWAQPQSWDTRNALLVLGSLGDPSSLELVQRRANSTVTWARIRSLVAATRLGDGAAPGRLVGEMDNFPAEWLPGFARALQHVAEPPARAQLAPALGDKAKAPDVDVALAAAAVILSWDPEQGVFRFLDALASPSAYERDLAEAYLEENDDDKLTWVLRRALAREGRDTTRDRLRALLDRRG